MPAFEQHLFPLPVGTSFGTVHGTRWVLSKSVFNAGKSLKVVGNALDGSDTISLNYYILARGPRLKPCEMPEQKIIEILKSFRRDPT